MAAYVLNAVYQTAAIMFFYWILGEAKREGPPKLEVA
jgi:hypothetical protein